MKNKIIFVSNRLPVTVRKEKEVLTYHESIGGLATGLNTIHKDQNIHSIWLGWCGLPEDDLEEDDREMIRLTLMERFNNVPVFLSNKQIDDYYYGFSNETLWPLFHYFTEYAVYRDTFWKSYEEVNLHFYEELKKILLPGDLLWIHDYQLLLLPQIVKRDYPDVQIGFFLHIPFPSFEIFRLLPWRKELLEGILGADLVGFHTYDYVRHFLSSVRRILGYEHTLGNIDLNHRQVKVDVFPMGIDYKKFSEASSLPEVQKAIELYRVDIKESKIILSIDRLDYTKGIPQRLTAFDLFLKQHPEYKEKVTMILVIAPSRAKVPHYIDLKKEVEVLVSQVNGKHGSLHWRPVIYFYKTFSFSQLVALYCLSNVLLITPNRDGMNLIVKEYIAARSDKKGILIISDTAGAVSELGEAMIVNPNNIQEIADTIKTALEVPDEQQIKWNTIMQQRLERYTVDYWAGDFIRKLSGMKDMQDRAKAHRMSPDIMKELKQRYSDAKTRCIFLDYDGTLMPFFKEPGLAVPDEELLSILKELAASSELVIISGRDRDFLEKWLGDLSVNLVAGHGAWIRSRGGEWRTTKAMDNSWKKIIMPIIELFTYRTPGSLIEEKEYSIAWHYRKCEPDLASVRVVELKTALTDFSNNLNIKILEGNKVLEAKDSMVNKGNSASGWLSRSWDFILAAGDDWTDEDLFAVLPEEAYSVKVGYGISRAKYYLNSPYDVRFLLKDLVELNHPEDH